jgi:hypothetical protein
MIFRRLKKHANQVLYNADELIDDLKDGFGIKIRVKPKALKNFIWDMLDKDESEDIELPFTFIVIPKEDAN